MTTVLLHMHNESISRCGFIDVLFVLSPPKTNIATSFPKINGRTLLTIDLIDSWDFCNFGGYRACA